MFQANTLPLGGNQSALNTINNMTFWDVPNQNQNQTMTDRSMSSPSPSPNNASQNLSATMSPTDLSAISNPSGMMANNGVASNNPLNVFYNSMPTTSSSSMPMYPLMNYQYGNPMAAGNYGMMGSNPYNYGQFSPAVFGGGGYINGYASPIYSYGNVPMMNYGGYPPMINYNTRPVMMYPSFNMMPPTGGNMNYSFYNPGIMLNDGANGFTNPSILSGGYDRNVRNGYVHGINRVLLPMDLPRANNDSSGGGGGAGQPPVTRTIADLLGPANSGYDGNAYDYDILRNLLTSSGLLNTVNDAKDATLFAPVDGAFYQLARDLGIPNNGYNEQQIVAGLSDALTKAGNGNAAPLLQDILKYHVSGSRLSLNDISRVTTIPTLLPDKNLGVVKSQPSMMPVNPIVR